jgi:hypothetical protein
MVMVVSQMPCVCTRRGRRLIVSHFETKRNMIPITVDKLIDSNRVSGYTSFDREVPSPDRDVCRSSQI